MENKRIYLYDNIKFLLIWLVVIGHFIDYCPEIRTLEWFRGIYVYIYAFHMPLFIFMSGLFFKSRDIVNKVFGFFAIYAVMKVITAVSEVIIGWRISFSLFFGAAPPWYMFALAGFMIISYVLRNVDKRLVLIIAVVVACFAGYDVEIGDKYALSRIIVFYPFFVAGTMTDPEKLDRVTNKGIYKALGGVILIVWGLFCGFDYYNIYKLRPLLTGRNNYWILKGAMADFGGLYRLLCYAISALLCFAVISLLARRKYALMTMVGEKTLQIYFWHTFFIRMLVEAPFIKTLVSTTAGQWVYLGLSFPFMLILTLKPFDYPCNLILKYSKSKEKEKIELK